MTGMEQVSMMNYDRKRKKGRTSQTGKRKYDTDTKSGHGEKRK